MRPQAAVLARRAGTAAGLALALLAGGRAAASRVPADAIPRADREGRVAAAPTPAPGPRATLPVRGSLLVADPSLSRGSSPLAETVVLLVEHRAAGAIGIALNRPGKAKLSSFDRSLSDLDARTESVFEGGPLERERLVLLVQAPEAPRDSLRITDDVWVTGSVEAVRELVRSGGSEARFRAFAGRAIWGPGQLDEEVRRGDWLVAPADVASVFTADPDRLWRRLVDRLSARWVRADPRAESPGAGRPAPTLPSPFARRHEPPGRGRPGEASVSARRPGESKRAGGRAAVGSRPPERIPSLRGVGQASAACAAARRAIGTRNGEQDT